MNTFYYKLFNNTNRDSLALHMVEELNRGYSFSITHSKEDIVPLSGLAKNWASHIIRDGFIEIHVEDIFFHADFILEQIFTSLWANLLDFGELRLEYFKLSDKMHNILSEKLEFKNNIPKIFNKDHTYFGTIFKPPFTVTLNEKIEFAKCFSELGGNILKEDETYFVVKDNILEESFQIQQAMNSVSDNCYYVPNITSYLLDSSFMQELFNIGVRIAMVNILITSMPYINKIISGNNLYIWGHRVGYKPIERYISMKVISLLAHYSGIDILHVGTPIFSNHKMVEETKDVVDIMKSFNRIMWPVFSKASYGILSDLRNAFGKNIIILSCGDIRTDGVMDLKKVSRNINNINGGK